MNCLHGFREIVSRVYVLDHLQVEETVELLKQETAEIIDRY